MSIDWNEIGKIWVLLLGLTLVFQMFKWLFEKLRK